MQHLRMDNAGENKKLVARMKCLESKLNVKVEFTARNAPQHNHLAKVGFVTLANRGSGIDERGTRTATIEIYNMPQGKNATCHGLGWVDTSGNQWGVGI